MGTPDIRLRPERLPDDEVFLIRLFAESRAHIFDPMPLLPAQKQMLITQQFHTQRFSYQTEFSDPPATFQLIEANGEPVGRLYSHENNARVHIIDISISALARGQGIGTKVLSKLMRKAQKRSKSVSLTVEHDRPAKRLYERLGFKTVKTDGLYVKMRAPATAR